MKILLLIDSLGPGGAQRQFVGLATMLAEAGNRVKVVTYHDINFYLSDMEHVEYEYLEDKGNYLHRIYNVHRVVRQFIPEWVISFLDSPNIIACILKAFGGDFKLLVSERSTTQSLAFKERMKFFLFRFSNTVVSNSYTQNSYIVENYPNLSKKSHVIPNFVDLKRFNIPSNGKFRSNKNRVVVVASIRDCKNTVGLIEASRIMKLNGAQFEIYWYGLFKHKDEYTLKCIQLIKEYNLESYFVFREKTSRIENAYNEADYFCLPSFYEGTPNVMCEAMASGLPVAVSRVSDMPRYVDDGKSGFLFDTNSIEDIVSALTKLFCLTAEEYQAFSVRNRMIAEHNFSKKLFMNNYLNLINQ